MRSSIWLRFAGSVSPNWRNRRYARSASANRPRSNWPWASTVQATRSRSGDAGGVRVTTSPATCTARSRSPRLNRSSATSVCTTGGLRMIRERRDEPEFVLDGRGVPLELRRVGERLLVLPGRKQRGVPGLGGLRVWPVAVSRALVLAGGGGEVAALVKDLRQQEVALRGLRVVGKILEVAAVPERRLLVRILRVGLLRALVIVARKIGEARLQVPDDHRPRGRRGVLPIGAGEAVELHVLRLGIEHLARELAGDVGVDHLGLQVGCPRMRRLAPHEAAVGIRRIAVALLGEIEVAQATVDHVGEGDGTALRQQGVDAGDAVELRHREAHRAQRVLDQLALRLRQAVEQRWSSWSATRARRRPSTPRNGSRHSS